MTRKTTSRAKRELEKLRRQLRNGDEPGDPTEAVVELAGVPARGLEDDPVTEEDVHAIECFTVDLETGKTERPDRPDSDDLDADDLDGMPEQDKPPELRSGDGKQNVSATESSYNGDVEENE